MTADLVAFLRARLDEDEQAIPYQRLGPYCPHCGAEVFFLKLVDGGPVKVYGSMTCGHLIGPRDELGAAVQTKDRRALAEVAAKHALLDIHTPVPTERGLAEGRPYRSCSTCEPYPPMDAPNPGSCPTLRLLARPYAEHPHFHPSWATE